MSAIPAWLHALKQLYGWRVDDVSAPGLARRIETAALASGWRIEQVSSAALSGDAEAKRLLAGFGAVNETYFFRDPEALVAALDARLGGRDAPAHVDVWSAGCATGEEPFTLAALLDDRVGDAFTVLASDVDEDALARARTGRYGAWSTRNGDPRLRAFAERDGRLEVPEALRAHVRFFPLNLARDAYPLAPHGHGFDLIVCRNVLTYFAAEETLGVLDRLADRLARGGYLVVGPLDATALPPSLRTAAGSPEGVLVRADSNLRAQPTREISAERRLPRVAAHHAPTAPPKESPKRTGAEDPGRSDPFVLLDRGSVELAHRGFEAILARTPSDALARFGLALCLDAQGAVEDARREAGVACDALSGRADDEPLGSGEVTCGMVRGLSASLTGGGR